MVLSRKSGLTVALLVFWVGWVHAPSAEARPSAVRLARSAPIERPAVKKRRLPKELSAAIRLYERLEYEAALEQFAKAKSSAWTPDDQSLALLYEGIVLANLGFTERSRGAFRDALRLQPSSVLPVVVSPKIAHLLQEVRDELQNESPSAGRSVPTSLEPAASSTSPLEAQATPAPVAPPSEPTPAEHVPSQPEPTPALAAPLPQPLERALQTGQMAEFPWAPEASAQPDDAPTVQSSQAAIAVGGVMAAAGLVLFATTGSAHPEHQSSLMLTGALVGMGGLGLVVFGAALTHNASPLSPPERGSQRGLALHSPSASVGARMSF